MEGPDNVVPTGGVECGREVIVAKINGGLGPILDLPMISVHVYAK